VDVGGRDAHRCLRTDRDLDGKSEAAPGAGPVRTHAPEGEVSYPDADVRSPTGLGLIDTVRNAGEVAWIPATPENSQSSTVPMKAWSRERAEVHDASSHDSHMVVAPHCRNNCPQPGAVGLVATW